MGAQRALGRLLSCASVLLTAALPLVSAPASATPLGAVEAAGERATHPPSEPAPADAALAAPPGAPASVAVAVVPDVPAPSLSAPAPLPLPSRAPPRG